RSARPAVRAGGPAAGPAPQRTYRLRTRVLPRAVDPEAAFAVLAGGAGPAFWLDSARPGPGTGRFSFLGGSDGPEAEVLTHRVAEGEVLVRDRAGRRRVPGGVLDHLAAQLAAPLDAAGGEQDGQDPRELPFD
ncbi:aminodeoxychorismate synthase component I, partial [Kineococcus sp. T90]|nr:aminodeoxychorismate synthase component I [Kineococcus indalonis]